MQNVCWDALPEDEARALRMNFRPRLDGNYEHKQFTGVSLARGPGAWASWFTSHLIERDALPMLGQTGLGCMPGLVKTYSKVYHLGPLKLYFGPRRS